MSYLNLVKQTPVLVDLADDISRLEYNESLEEKVKEFSSLLSSAKEEIAPLKEDFDLKNEEVRAFSKILKASKDVLTSKKKVLKLQKETDIARLEKRDGLLKSLLAKQEGQQFEDWSYTLAEGCDTELIDYEVVLSTIKMLYPLTYQKHIIRMAMEFLKNEQNGTLLEKAGVKTVCYLGSKDSLKV
jgi:hypothetical protein